MGLMDWIKGKGGEKPRDEPARRGRIPMQSVPRPRADATLQGNEAIYAAVSRIANTMASMPMRLYKGYAVQRDHPLNRLVELEPNPNFSAYVFRQTMEVMRNTEGNAYALILRDKLGQVERLDVLNPTRVRPEVHRETQQVWYGVLLDDHVWRYVPSYMIINLRHMSGNGEKGIRPVDVLAGSLDYDAQVKEIALDHLDGVNHGVMLTVPNTGLDADRQDALVNRFLETYKESNRSVVVLEGGMTAATFGVSPVDAKLLDVERITRNRVATVYNLPPHMLGDYTDTSFSTAEQQMQEFLQLTIIPIVQQWEDEFNRKLLTPGEYGEGYRFRFDTEALVRADAATMAEKHQKAIRGGWMRPNEVRQREGLPPDDNGDELLISRDMIPLTVSVEHPELLLTGKTADADGKE